MSFEITYRPLCSVEIMHHFSLNEGLNNFEGHDSISRVAIRKKYDIRTLFNVIPSIETRKQLSGQRQLFKQNSSGFKVLTLMDADNENMPLIIPGSQNSLCFLIVVKDPVFYTVSNIPFETGKILFFNNFQQPSSNFPDLSAIPNAFDTALATEKTSDGDPNSFAYQQGDMLVDNNINPTKLYLAKCATNENLGHPDWEEVYPTDEYDHGTNYEKGDVVWYNDGSSEDLYEAITDNHQSHPDTAADWEKISPLPILYSSRADMQTVKYHQLEYSFSIFDQELSISITDINGDEVYSATFEPNETVPTLVIEGSKLVEGWLNVNVKDELDAEVLTDQLVFIKGKSLEGHIAGLIQININASQSEYNLLNGDNTLRSPVFRIRIKNRKTNWRYYSASGEKLLETEPNPLVSSGYIKVQIDGNDLPNPGYSIIQPSIQKTYSDVYLNL